MDALSHTLFLRVLPNKSREIPLEVVAP
nr:unnamed protein product [Digitaria exilis]